MIAVQKLSSGSTEKVDVTLDRAIRMPGWYCICPAGIKEDFYQSIADWTEANEKLCICETTGISHRPFLMQCFALRSFMQRQRMTA